MSASEASEDDPGRDRSPVVHLANLPARGGPGSARSQGGMSDKDRWMALWRLEVLEPPFLVVRTKESKDFVSRLWTLMPSGEWGSSQTDWANGALRCQDGMKLKPPSAAGLSTMFTYGPQAITELGLTVIGAEEWSKRRNRLPPLVYPFANMTFNFQTSEARLLQDEVAGRREERIYMTQRDPMTGPSEAEWSNVPNTAEYREIMETLQSILPEQALFEEVTFYLSRAMMEEGNKKGKRQQMVFVGETSDGKSTLQHLMQFAFGDVWTQTVDPEHFTSGAKSTGPTSALAQLMDKRLAIAAEPDGPLASNICKRYTSDKQSARGMRENDGFAEFCKFTLCVSMNLEDDQTKIGDKSGFRNEAVFKTWYMPMFFADPDEYVLARAGLPLQSGRAYNPDHKFIRMKDEEMLQRWEDNARAYRLAAMRIFAEQYVRQIEIGKTVRNLTLMPPVDGKTLMQRCAEDESLRAGIPWAEYASIDVSSYEEMLAFVGPLCSQYDRGTAHTVQNFLARRALAGGSTTKLEDVCGRLFKMFYSTDHATPYKEVWQAVQESEYAKTLNLGRTSFRAALENAFAIRRVYNGTAFGAGTERTAERPLEVFTTNPGSVMQIRGLFLVNESNQAKIAAAREAEEAQYEREAAKRDQLAEAADRRARLQQKQRLADGKAQLEQYGPFKIGPRDRACFLQAHGDRFHDFKKSDGRLALWRLVFEQCMANKTPVLPHTKTFHEETVRLPEAVTVPQLHAHKAVAEKFERELCAALGRSFLLDGTIVHGVHLDEPVIASDDDSSEDEGDDGRCTPPNSRSKRDKRSPLLERESSRQRIEDEEEPIDADMVAAMEKQDTERAHYQRAFELARVGVDTRALFEDRPPTDRGPNVASGSGVRRSSRLN